MRLNVLQKKLYNNEIDNDYNVEDVDREFCNLYGKVASSYYSYRKDKKDIGKDLADIELYLLKLSEMLNIDLEDQIIKRISKKNKDD